MKILICALTASAIAGFTPTIASAADLGRGYEEFRDIQREAGAAGSRRAPLL